MLRRPFTASAQGSREEPLLFFSLRGVDTNKFVDVVISSRVESMLANVDKPSDRIIRDTRLEDLFGVL